MIGIVAVLSGIAGAAAVVVFVASFRPAVARAQRTRPRLNLAQAWVKYTRKPAGKAGRRRDLMWAVAAGVGVVAAILTGWIVIAPATVAAVVLAPVLLGSGQKSDLPLLEALDRWVRHLATTVPLGRSVIQAVRISRASAPPVLRVEVSTLVRRLDAGWTADDAFHQFADDVDNPEADAVIASLLLATTHTTGVVQNLKSVADSIQDRIRVARQIETEQAKPRTTVRYITILSSAMVGVAMLVGGSYFAPYSTPLGQVLLTVIILSYIGSILLLHRMARPRTRARILVRPAASHARDFATVGEGSS